MIYKTLHRKRKRHINTNTLKNQGGELRCSGRDSSSCFTSGTRRVAALVKNLVASDIKEMVEL